MGRAHDRSGDAAVLVIVLHLHLNFATVAPYPLRRVVTLSVETMRIVGQMHP